MRILVAGGTGFIGRRLCRSLGESGHEIVVLSRKEGRAPEGAARVVAGHADWSDAVEGAGAIVNLTGAGVADRRWTERRRNEILDTRLQSTRRLVEAIRRAKRKPEVLVNASGVGYYGDRGAEMLNETSSPGGGFLARVCLAWEAEAAKAEEAGARAVFARIGVVLGAEGGALPRMLPPFRLGVGGPLGSGRQYMSWIHAADAAALLRFAVEKRELHGPMNVCAPSPATNREFSRALASALGRPCLFVVPGLVLRAALGEMSSLLLESQRAEPAAAKAAGFAFRFPELGAALKDLTAR